VAIGRAAPNAEAKLTHALVNDSTAQTLSLELLSRLETVADGIDWALAQIKSLPVVSSPGDRRGPRVEQENEGSDLEGTAKEAAAMRSRAEGTCYGRCDALLLAAGSHGRCAAG
jgi:hypothetical protein